MAQAFARVGLPVAIAVVGVVLILTGDDAAVGAGIVLIGVSLLVVLANLMLRLSLSSERDREREEENRRGVLAHRSLAGRAVGLTRRVAR